MKVLIVANKGSNHAKKVAEGLAQLGHTIIFASPNDKVDGSVILDSRVILVTLPYGGKKGYLLNFFALKRLNKRISPDVVNVHYASGCGFLAYLAGLKPVVLSCYGSDIFEFPNIRRINRFLLLRVLRSAQTLASTSNAMAEEIRRLLSDKEREIAITPFGINTTLFKPALKKDHPEKRVVGIIKTLSPIYDIQLLIKAFKLVSLSQCGVVLKIYGDGPQRQELIDLSSSLGLSALVEFAGRISNNDVPKALHEMDIFINCSKQESFGVNILEAMSCGLPVVATDCVGPQELMIDGQTGIIVRDRNPQALANAIISLLNDENRCIEMGKRGRERVCAKYDWNNNVKEIERVLYNNI